MRHFFGKIKEGVLVSLSARSIISCGSNPSQSIIRICVPSNQVDQTAPLCKCNRLFLSTSPFFVHPPPFRHYFTKTRKKDTVLLAGFVDAHSGCVSIVYRQREIHQRPKIWIGFKKVTVTCSKIFITPGRKRGGAAQKWLFTNQTLSYLHWQLHWYCHWHKLWFRDAFAILEMCTLLIIVCWSEILGKSHLLGYLKSIMTEEGTSCGWLTWLDQLRNWK